MAEEGKLKRVLISAVLHETHTFNPLATKLSDFTVVTHERIPAVFDGINTETSGFLDAARRYGWEIVHPVVAKATSGGRTSSETFEHIVGLLTEGIAEAVVEPPGVRGGLLAPVADEDALRFHKEDSSDKSYV